MPTLSRADNSVLGRWWWTVDRWTLGAIGTLIGFGYIMMLAASPAVAERIGSSRDLFILKQVFFLAAAGAIVVAVSLLSPRSIRRLAIIGCLIALALTAATMVIGVEIKGARRWISLPGMSVQPSEFLKPCFTIVAAWLISEGRRTPRFPGKLLAIGIFLLIALLLKSQPDVGMLAVITAVFFAQLYVDGLNLFLVGIAADRHRVRRRRRLHVLPARAEARGELPASRQHAPAATISRTPRWRRSAMAACSAAAPARAASRTCCPTRTPTSCSPSPARNSA